MAHKWKVKGGLRSRREDGAAMLTLHVHVVDPDRADALVTTVSVEVPANASRDAVRAACRTASRAAWDAYQAENAAIDALVGEEGTET
jgi:hypothetical protein